MKLAELLKDRFRGDIRFRGEQYLKKEQIELVHVAADAVFALITDVEEFQTQLHREDNELKMECSCSNRSSSQQSCKHLWATLLLVDESRILSGSARPGFVPPFVTDSAAGRALQYEDDADEWDDEFDESPYLSPASMRGIDTLPVREWEAKLRKIRSNQSRIFEAGNENPRERQVFYEIDLTESRKQNQFVLMVMQQQRRTNGQWGKLKPLKVRSEQLSLMPSETDRQIMATLIGGIADRGNWFNQQADMQTSSHRFTLPTQLSRLLLPRLCETKRFRLQDADTPLSWDQGPDWHMVMRVVQDDQDKNWNVESLLERDNQRLNKSQIDLIVPGGYVVACNQIATVQDTGLTEWLPLFANGENISVPDGEENDLVDTLLDMPSLPELELPEELQLQEVHADPKPLLTLKAPGGKRWKHDIVCGMVAFDYLGQQLPAHSGKWAIVQREESRCLVRDRKQESQRLVQLEESGFHRVMDHTHVQHDVEIPTQELGSAVRKLIAQDWQVQADGQPIRQAGEMQFQIKSGIDWFELHGQVDFAGGSVAFPELLASLGRGETTIRLDDGSVGILPEEWAQQFGLLAGLGETEEDHLRFANNQVAILDALLSAQESVDFDSRFAEIRERIRNFSGVSTADELKQFKGKLRTYQKEGLGWLQFLNEFQLGGCLADDMGLGKTVQLLALLQHHYHKKKKLKPSLIIVPKSLLFNWQEEGERFTPDMKILEYTGLNRAELRNDFENYNIILTTYGTLRRDIIELKDIEFEYVVLDEAQAIKNANSQVAKASRLLQAKNRIALSGTPIENHLGDLWSIFEFLNPGMLGRSSLFKIYAANAEDAETRKLIAQGLGPFILRRTKTQVAKELPDKSEQTIHCAMNKEQRRLYGELREHYRDSLLGMVKQQGLAKSKMHVLEALLRLRQVACHPGLVDDKYEDEPSGKLDVLFDHLEELMEEGHKALVFSQFTSLLAIVRKTLDERNVNYEYLDGKTRNRQARVKHFQEDPDCPLFLGSLKAGGLGLNLTAAGYVFLLDPWWNPAVEAQAIDRAHRIGQTQHVFAYRLISRDSVEEKILELQNKKRSLAEAILMADNASPLSDLSTDDLEMLLS